MGHLHHQLLKIVEAHPDKDYTELLTGLGIKLVNTVEMYAQKAAWYFLRQPMSSGSREVVCIPTVLQKSRKRCEQMDRDNLAADSIEVWTKNCIERYQKRRETMETVYLAAYNTSISEKSNANISQTELSAANNRMTMNSSTDSFPLFESQNFGNELYSGLSDTDIRNWTKR